MAKDSLEIKDEITHKDITPSVKNTRKNYVVTEKALRESVTYPDDFTSEGSFGIFKNGRIYGVGEIIELDENTAAGFLALGEVIEVENE